MTVLTKPQARLRRHKRVRGKVAGTADRPRLVVTRSNRGIVAQLVDDSNGRGGYLYHGRVKALADAAREGGLKF
jgi:ribosomal protein L18